MWPNQETAFRNMMSALICALSPASAGLFILRIAVPWVMALTSDSNSDEWRRTLTKPDHSLALLLSELDVFGSPVPEETEERPKIAADEQDCSDVALKETVGSSAIGREGSDYIVSRVDGKYEVGSSRAEERNASFTGRSTVSQTEARNSSFGRFSSRGSVHITPSFVDHDVKTVKEAGEQWEQLLTRRAAELEAERALKFKGLKPASAIRRVFFDTVDQQFVEADSPVVSDWQDISGRDDPPQHRPSIPTRLVEGSPLQQRLHELQQRRKCDASR
jgi:hypothetical protein